MNKYKLVLLLILFVSGLYAQNSGYMGKKMIAGYGFHMSPGYFGTQGENIINKIHEGYVEYATSKRFVLGAATRFYKTIYANQRNVSIFSIYGNYVPTQVNSNPQGYYNMKGANYLLYGKLFKSGYVAPWGRYFMFGATLNTFQANYDPSIMKVLVREEAYGTFGTAKEYYYSNFGLTHQSFVKFDLLIGFGRTRMIADRVVLDYGFNANAIALARVLFDVISDLDRTSEEGLPPYDYVAKTSASRVRALNRFNVFLRIGFLLF